MAMAMAMAIIVTMGSVQDRRQSSQGRGSRKKSIRSELLLVIVQYRFGDFSCGMMIHSVSGGVTAEKEDEQDK